MRRGATDFTRRWVFSMRCMDGVQGIDRWLIEDAGAENTPHVRAAGTLMLVAGVRRIRSPSCRFDEMPVLISQQGRDSRRHWRHWR